MLQHDFPIYICLLNARYTSILKLYIGTEASQCSINHNIILTIGNKLKLQYIICV